MNRAEYNIQSPYLEPCQLLTTTNSSFCTPLAEGTYWLGRVLTWPLHHGVERMERLTQRSLNKDWHGRLESLRLEILRRVWWAVSGFFLSVLGLVPAIVGGILMFLANLDKEDMTVIQPKEELKERLTSDAGPKITTFNLGALPDYITVRNQMRPLEERIEWFIDHVMKHQDADILCLQELFDQNAIRLIVKRCREKYPYMVVDVAPRTFGMNSGLAVLSKYPIQDPAFWKFNEALDEDAMANKGVLGLKIKAYQDRDIVVLNTHFQSGYAERYQNIRAHSIEGIEKIYAMYEKVYQQQENSITMFTTGDFNLHEYEDERKTWVDGKEQDVTYENWNEGELKKRAEWKRHQKFFYKTNRTYKLPAEGLNPRGTCWLKKSPHTLWNQNRIDEWPLQQNRVDYILVHRSHHVPQDGRVRTDRMNGCSDHVAVCFEPKIKNVPEQDLGNALRLLFND